LPYFLILLVLTARIAGAREYHVSTNGNDAGEGSSSKPFRTISAAAQAAQPGDVITVHAGTYRERINPPRGGVSDRQRIVYQAARGEKVEIKGSEVIKNWEKVQDDTWKAVIPNSFFGNFNPYIDFLHGDWFWDRGRTNHTGAVYLNGEWLIEAARMEDVLKPVGKDPLWFGQVDQANTAIWAQFKGVNPNEQMVEINVRRTIFYPEKPGMNYITVSGFTMRHAATPWSPPTAEQVGLIGTHWSRGWIIENNIVSHSKCVGVSLGKYGDEWDNKSSNSAEGYVGTINRALANGWNKETVGSHIVRNNTISHCEQAGIVGSLGAVFSSITGNTIHDIYVQDLYHGCEQGGIKIHAAIDVEIRGNRIYKAYRGLWMDWMAQGTRITGNLCYENSAEDLYVEVNHGPFLVDNNLFLSQRSLWDMSEGGAYVHNLMTGKIDNWYDMSRFTPYMKAHSTSVAGKVITKGGDNRFYNNIFVGQGPSGSVEKKETNPKKSIKGFGLWVYDARGSAPQTGGNVYLNGARPFVTETNQVVRAGEGASVKLTDEGDHVFLNMTMDSALLTARTAVVTTEVLGKTAVSGCAYENPDGSSLKVDRDYSGKKRSGKKPSAGPFEDPGDGQVKLKVW